MRIEDRLKESLSRMSASEPPTGDAWSRFERRARRDRVQRVTASLAAAAVLIAGFAVAVPRLVGSAAPEPGFVNPPDTKPSESPAPRETVAPETFPLRLEDEVAGYSVRMPEGWVQPLAQGNPVKLHPEELATDSGDPAFFVGIEPVRRETSFEDNLAGYRERLAEHGRLGADVTETDEVSIGGKRTVSFGVVYPDRDERASGWCRGCRTVEYVAEWGRDLTLHVTIVLHPEADRDRYEPLGYQVVSTIEAIEPSGGPATGRGRHGTVADGVPWDELTSALVQFLDARIDGRGAEQWLTQNAFDLYQAGENGLSLYSPTSNPHYESYTVDRREGVDANSVEFTVTISEAYTGGNDAVPQFTETIGVGPGENLDGEMLEAVVRHARR